ncbi:MAG: M56 family metallopeptidase [Ruminococcus sp.]|nr:M56 family metallopeptidase [Ruminococcus sp.]
MNDTFLTILNLSITASIVVVAVLLLRLGMKKAPKWISAALWVFVGLRLIFPFAVESHFSIIPSIDTFSIQSTPSAESFKVHTGVNAINSAVNDHIVSSGTSGAIVDVVDVLAVLWLAGAAVLLIYGIISYILLYIRVRTAIPLKDNIYQSENVKSPFVLGFIKPRIFVPFSLDETTLEHVASHEKAHIKRGDHFVKPFAYVLLCLHWFNPLIWLSYILLCRDIEVACDEKVIKGLTFSERKNYALALLTCKVKNTTTAVCPVAFGEVSVKSRIKNTLSYKKPALWVIIAAVAVSVVASGCLLTNPKAEPYSEETIINDKTHISNESALAQQNLGVVDGVAAVEFTTEADVERAETSTKSTEAELEHSDESQGEFGYDYIYDESFTVHSFDEYYAEVIVPQIEAEIMRKRYETLKKETYNHSDACQCSNCDELREAGIYPPLVVEEPTEAIVTEPTQDYTEGAEYYYYEYDDSAESEYTELPPLVATKPAYISPYEGYDSDYDFGISADNKAHTPTFPVIQWAP